MGHSLEQSMPVDWQGDVQVIELFLFAIFVVLHAARHDLACGASTQ
jgi:hypothetical protein